MTTAKPLRQFTGHSDFVQAVAFTPDGKALVSCSKDRTVRVVDADGGAGRFTLSGMEQDVLAVAVSPDGARIVSSGFDTGLYWWDARTGQRQRVQPGHGVAVNEVCFSRDGRLVASAGSDRTVRLWDRETGNEVRRLPHATKVRAVAFSPDGRLLASATLGKVIRLWEVATGKPAGEFRVGVTTTPDPDNAFFNTAAIDGENTLLWSDLAQGNWVTPAATFDATKLKDIQFQVASGETGPITFDFCVSNIKFVGGGDGLGGEGGGPNL